MDSTYLSLFIFAIITIVYYLVKPGLTMTILSGEPITKTTVGQDGVETQESIDPMAAYTKQSYLYLIIYVLLVVITQFFVNSSILINKCGGNVSTNFAAGAFMTFIPWALIFGSIVLIIIAFPGFKSAFSNVIGYFAVSGKANTILNELLVNSSVQANIDQEQDVEKKAALQKSAEAILKVCGNVSIMINQIVPENFMSYWAILMPLMKDRYQNKGSTADKEELKSLQEQLLGVVVMRDNIGEAMWYFYTAIFLISIVQYNLSTRGCIMDPSVMAENHQKFLDEEDAKLKANATSSEQVYSG